MDAKRVTSPARRRLLWAASAAGLIAVTAVVASSVAGATPFFPSVPGFARPSELDGSVVLDGVNFPVLYAAEGSSSTCVPGIPDCRQTPHLFTLTKPVDSATPALAQAAADGKLYKEAVITIASGKEKLITYRLADVKVADDHEQFEKVPSTTVSQGTLKEVVTLKYTKIEWAVGSVKTGWDWATNSKS